MKKLFLAFAALLLTSATAFAQVQPIPGGGSGGTFTGNITSFTPTETSGTIDANAECVTLSFSGWGSAMIQVVGTMDGTLAFTGSGDTTNYAAWAVTPLGSSTSATGATAAGVWIGVVTGLNRVRVCSTAWSSGSVVVTLRATVGGGSSGSGGGGGTNAAASATAAAVPSSASYSGVNISGNLVGATGFALGATTKAQSVAIVDASGVQITSFGGGTQYATAAAQATPTGTVALGHDGSNVRALLTDASGNLQVEFGSAQAITNSVLTSSAVAIDGSASTATTLLAAGGVASTSAPSWTTGRNVPLSFDLSGGLRISSDVLSDILTQVSSSASSLVTVASTLNSDTPHGDPHGANGPQGMLSFIAAPVAVDDGEAVRARGSNKGEAYGIIRDAAGNGRGANVSAANELQITGTVLPGNTANTTPWLFTIAQGGNSAAVNASGQLSTTCANCTAVTIAEDTASVTGDAGTPAYSIRADTPASTTSNTGDYQPLKTDSVGRLWTNPFGITQAAATYLTMRLSDGTNFLTPGTDYTHDAALTPSTTAGPVMMGRSSAAAPTDVGADNEAVMPWMLRNGSQVVNLAAGGSLITATSNALNVNVSASALPSGAATAANQATANGYLLATGTPATPGLMRSDGSDVEETEVKGTAGVLLYISARNSSADTNAFVRCVNLAAASHTPGATAPIFEMMVPFGGGFVQGNLGPAGMTFSTALTCYVATGAAANSTAVAAVDTVVVNFGYR